MLKISLLSRVDLVRVFIYLILLPLSCSIAAWKHCSAIFCGKVETLLCFCGIFQIVLALSRLEKALPVDNDMSLGRMLVRLYVPSCSCCKLIKAIKLNWLPSLSQSLNTTSSSTPHPFPSKATLSQGSHHIYQRRWVGTTMAAPKNACLCIEQALAPLHQGWQQEFLPKRGNATYSNSTVSGHIRCALSLPLSLFLSCS